MKEVTEFERKVYELMTKIPKGKVTTYGELAKALGDPHLSRAVGNAVRDNPFAPKVPCHRVIKSTGEIGGFCGETDGESIDRKIEMLREEGVDLVTGRKIDLGRYLVRGEELRKSLGRR